MNPNQLIALCSGAAIAVMVAMNGELTNAMGAYSASAVTHAVGMAFDWIA